MKILPVVIVLIKFTGWQALSCQFQNSLIIHEGNSKKYILTSVLKLEETTSTLKFFKVLVL